jgi:hypothetical protein
MGWGVVQWRGKEESGLKKETLSFDLLFKTEILKSSLLHSFIPLTPFYFSCPIAVFLAQC